MSIVVFNMRSSTDVHNDVIKKCSYSTVSLKGAQFVLKMLKDIPEDVRYLFIPKTEDELFQLEFSLISFGKRQETRMKVIQIQKEFGLPLRPNMSLKEVGVLVRIELLRRKNTKRNVFN